MTAKLTDEQREELNETGNLALQELEEQSVKLLDVIELYTLGDKQVDVKQIDDVYKNVKKAAKETRKISQKYLKHLESMENQTPIEEDSTDNQTGEFTA